MDDGVLLEQPVLLTGWHVPRGDPLLLRCFSEPQFPTALASQSNRLL